MFKQPAQPEEMSLRRSVLADEDFVRLNELIKRECGIHLTYAKKTMLEARLQKRIRALGLPSFRAYCDYVFRPGRDDTELIHLIDAVTTNKTDFFREAAHYRYLTEKALPDLTESYGAGIERTLWVWSAGCSTGEEPYTLAMVLSEFASRVETIRFEILATDISTKVLETARQGIYRADNAEPIPLALRRKYLLKSKDKASDLIRIVPELRSKVRFRRLNLMDAEYDMDTKYDVVFFRNVMIYFDRETQKEILERMCRHIAVGGFLFIGHSETLTGMALPLQPVSPSVYRRIR